MREVVIHIGHAKTGTSAIQEALHGYRDLSTRYACFPECNHSGPMTTIFKKNPMSHILYRRRFFTEYEVMKLKKIYKAQLEWDLNDATLQRLIISGEGIFNFEAEEVKEMLNFFKLRNWSCKILCFVRNPIDLTASRSNQFIKVGPNPKEVLFDTKKKLLPFIDNLGLQNINIFDYSNLVKNNNNIVDFISKFLNISLKNNTFVNESLSLEATAIAYKLNSTPIDFMRSPKLLDARRNIINKAALYFALSKGFKKPDPLIFLGLLKKETVEEDCKWLKDLFGIEYNFNVNDYKEHNISKYFEDALIRIPELLKDFFSQFQINFDTLISMDKNFTNLFTNQIKKFGTSIPNEYLKKYKKLSEHNKKLKIKNFNFNIGTALHGSILRLFKSIIIKLKFIFK
jgi:hypothetical protein